MITITDWRDAASHEIQPLLDRESRRWRDDLGWDVRHSWRVIEPARASRALPGFVARDAGGAVIGWTWFLQHRRCLQVAALASDRADVTHALVDAIQASPESLTSECSVWSVRDGAPAIDDALCGGGLRTTRYLYLSVDLTHRREGRKKSAPAPGRAWKRADLPAAAALFRAAYGTASGGDAIVRPFAPRGTLQDWQDYLRTLVDTDGCGKMIPDASRIVVRRDSVIACIVTSMIDAERGTAHISQVAVSPDTRGERLGPALVREAMDVCCSLGCRTMTLLVGRENSVARKVYENAGFGATAEFVVATSIGSVLQPRRLQPRRSTSVALAMGGVSTRR